MYKPSVTVSSKLGFPAELELFSAHVLDDDIVLQTITTRDDETIEVITDKDGRHLNEVLVNFDISLLARGFPKKQQTGIFHNVRKPGRIWTCKRQNERTDFREVHLNTPDLIAETERDDYIAGKQISLIGPAQLQNIGPIKPPLEYSYLFAVNRDRRVLSIPEYGKLSAMSFRTETLDDKPLRCDQMVLSFDLMNALSGRQRPTSPLSPIHVIEELLRGNDTYHERIAQQEAELANVLLYYHELSASFFASLPDAPDTLDASMSNGKGSQFHYESARVYQESGDIAGFEFKYQSGRCQLLLTRNSTRHLPIFSEFLNLYREIQNNIKNNIDEGKVPHEDLGPYLRFVRDNSMTVTKDSFQQLLNLSQRSLEQDDKECFELTLFVIENIIKNLSEANDSRSGIFYDIIAKTIQDKNTNRTLKNQLTHIMYRLHKNCPGLFLSEPYSNKDANSEVWSRFFQVASFLGVDSMDALTVYILNKTEAILDSLTFDEKEDMSQYKDQALSFNITALDMLEKVPQKDRGSTYEAGKSLLQRNLVLLYTLNRGFVDAQSVLFSMSESVHIVESRRKELIQLLSLLSSAQMRNPNSRSPIEQRTLILALLNSYHHDHALILYNYKKYLDNLCLQGQWETALEKINADFIGYNHGKNTPNEDYNWGNGVRHYLLSYTYMHRFLLEGDIADHRNAALHIANGSVHINADHTNDEIKAWTTLSDMAQTLSIKAEN